MKMGCHENVVKLIGNVTMKYVTYCCGGWGACQISILCHAAPRGKLVKFFIWRSLPLFGHTVNITFALYVTFACYITSNFYPSYNYNCNTIIESVPQNLVAQNWLTRTVKIWRPTVNWDLRMSTKKDAFQN